jgi:hypothetical protein
LLNKKIDLFLDNKGLNIFDNIRKSINLLIIILLEYREFTMFFLEFSLFISIKVRVDNRTNNNTSLNRSFY